MEKCKKCGFGPSKKINSKYCQLCVKSNLNGFVNIKPILKNWKEEILQSRQKNKGNDFIKTLN